MVESRWVRKFDDVSLSREEVFDLIEEGLWALGFMIVEKDGENGRMVTRLKSSYVDSFGSVAFKKNQKQVSISVSYEIITPELMEPLPDEKIVESEKTKLEDSWKNLIRMIDTLFSNGFIPLPEITINSCPNCGREIDWDSNFCKYCGHKLR
ncbi:MAG: zinc ribbon domain-containing protein [Candidatus Freyarchaeota archaeon]